MNFFLQHFRLDAFVLRCCKHFLFPFRRGIPDVEIEALFAKYDNDGDMILNLDEQKRLHTDLEKQKVKQCRNCSIVSSFISVFVNNQALLFLKFCKKEVERFLVKL